MTLLSSYPPFLSVLWTMAVFFAWIIWFWLLITVFSDLFRRHDASGFTKVLWMIFVTSCPTWRVHLPDRKPRRHDRTRRERATGRPATARPAHPIGRAGQLHRGDRKGEAARRQRRDQPGRIRIPKAKALA